MEPTDALEARERRRQWMRTLALSPLEALEAAYQALSLQPTYQFLRRPESGAIMLRGRVAGEGAVFNMGEATLTRCTILLQDGPAGTGYVLGCNPRKAELMALCDALLQDRRFHGRIMQGVIEPLEEQRRERRAALARETAATKVDFFTLARGE